MKKVILVKTGEEVKLGEVIKTSGKFKHPLFGEIMYDESFTLTEEIMEKMLAHGILKIVEEPEVTRSIDMDFLISKLAMKAGWKSDKMAGILNKIDNLNPGAAFSILLREIALELDRKYKGNIKDCKEVWAVSAVYDNVFKIPVHAIKHWERFAAFRTEEDAKFALDFLINFFKSE